jgi:hypothetical protein
MILVNRPSIRLQLLYGTVTSYVQLLSMEVATRSRRALAAKQKAANMTAFSRIQRRSFSGCRRRPGLRKDWGSRSRVTGRRACICAD